MSDPSTPGGAPGDTQMPFRMVVGAVSPDPLRVAGTILSGRIAAGDLVAAAISGRTATIGAIRDADDRPRGAAGAGEGVTIELDADLAAGPGDLLGAAGARPEVSDQVAAEITCGGAEALIPGRTYGFLVGAQAVAGSITEIKHRIDPATGSALAGKIVRPGERAMVNLSFARPVAFDAFADDPATGGFAIRDRAGGGGGDLGSGRIAFGLRRATNIHWQAVDIDKAARARAKGQTPVLLWFTGLSGAGKSAIANRVERALFARGRHTYLLDGDNLRHGLNRDLGFTEADRVENIRRVAETARLMLDAGLIVLASFISPFRADRAMARGLAGEGEFVEIFVDTPLAVAEARDPKGLYRRARAGLIRNFTGIDSPYEPPVAPELRLDAGTSTPEALAEEVLGFLETRGFRF